MYMSAATLVCLATGAWRPTASACCNGVARSMDPITPATLVQQLIQWMRTESVGPTRTRLVKFLYLADLQWARYRGGVTFTGWRWYVHTFGPIAAEALGLLDDGVAAGWLHQTILGESDDVEDERRAVVYDVTQYASPSDTMFPAEFGKVREWIRRYGDFTSQLLRFVYGETEPMDSAVEGDELDFRRALRPPSMPAPPVAPISKKTRRKMDELMSRIRDGYARSRAASAIAPDGPRDAEYLAGLPDENTEAPTQPVRLLFGKG